MISLRQQAADYLRAPHSPIWTWAENNNVIVWQDGTTIAFREEIAALIEWLAPRNLPPFGSIVLLLAACKGKVPNTSLIMGPSAVLLSKVAAEASVLAIARRQLTTQVEAALTELKRLSSLPADVTSGLKAKCVLAEAVFDHARAERHAEAAPVLELLRDSAATASLNQAELAASNQVRQLHIVAEGLKQHSAESLRLRLTTSLDALPTEIDASLPAAERARRLIEELSRDPEHGAIARAARELLAAVRLPRRLAHRDELAIGGVADITNRGPLDRLLLSELAHDDLTLAVRVALNEALYLRREPPMREPPGALALLLDSGVRLWGLPRVFATAVALALAAQEKQTATVFAWRATGAELAPVDLFSRAGLIAHLGALEVDAHPGAALSAFAKAAPAQEHQQSVLITHRDALDDPDFRKALAAADIDSGFVAVVDRLGRFEMHSLPLARRRPVCEADLDIASVFAEPGAAVALQSRPQSNLPAILGQNPFPFLLPIAGRVDCWVSDAAGTSYIILNDRRLVQIRDQHRGGRVLAANLSGGLTLWMGCVNETLHAVKAAASQRPGRLLSFSLPCGPLRTIDLPSSVHLLALHQCGDVLLLIGTQEVHALSLKDGHILATAKRRARWMHGRFISFEGRMQFITWDGTSIQFKPLTLPSQHSPGDIVRLFDREGLDGPWFVHRDGTIYSTAGAEAIRAPVPPANSRGIDAAHVSRDGHRVLLQIRDPQWSCIMDLKSGRAEPPHRGRMIDLNVVPPLPIRNLFRVIDCIAPLPDGIALRGRKGRWRTITLDSGNRERMHLRDAGLGLGTPVGMPFPDQPVHTDHACTLRAAKWPNGSRVFLDSRGLLHFKSHDPMLPEVSLVMADGEVAGWTSMGACCGPDFFFENRGRAGNVAAVHFALTQFLKSL